MGRASTPTGREGDRTALLVAHHHTSSPGGVGRYLADHGYRLTTLCLGDERPVDLPSSDDFDVVVVLGSSHSVTELDRPDAPSRRWMAPEVAWVADAVRRGSRVLGICFGAQAMSRGLGGTVDRMPETQVGWFDLDAADGEDPVFGGPWLEYHDDRFTVPGGARELASDRFCPQAFTIGRSLAVQFHPEADLAIVQRWVDASPPTRRVSPSASTTGRWSSGPSAPRSPRPCGASRSWTCSCPWSPAGPRTRS